MWTRHAQSTLIKSFARIFCASVITVLTIGWPGAIPASAVDGLNSFPVVSSSDDAGPNPTMGCSYAINWNEVYFGECTDGSSITSGFRFPNIALPRGTKIAQAYLEFTVDGLYTDQLTLALYGEATGNAQPFSSASSPANRTLTTQSVPWTIPSTDLWMLGLMRQSPSLTAIVQAILNRPDWTTGNALAIVVKNTAPATGMNRHRRVIAYDRQLGAASYPKLVILIDTPISGLKATNSGPTPLGQATTFNATISAGTNVTYQWDFGDGQSGNGAAASHTYAAVGAYTATVTAENSQGSVTATTTVNITDVPIGGLNATNTSPTQLGQATTFNVAIGAGTNVTYQWNFGDGQSGSGATPTHSYTNVGVYTAAVTATNSQGSGTATTTVKITDVPISGLHATNSGPTPLGQATTFNAMVGAGTNVAYAWNFGDGQSGSGATPTHTYAAIGAYVATVIATNGQGSAINNTSVAITGCHNGSCSFTVVSSSDDAGPNPVFICTYATTSNEIYFGECPDGSPITSGFRFPNIALPPGTKIIQAYLEFTVDGLYTDQLALALYGEATGNAQPFSLVSTPASRALTSQFVPWAIPSTDHWQFNETRKSPQLTAIVQAILNRPDWVTGNALAIMVKNNGPATGVNRHRRVIAYDRQLGAASYSKLMILIDTPISGLHATNTSPTPLGQPTTFTATISAGTNVIYRWDFGNGQNGSGATSANLYATVGAYTATITATNSQGSATAKTTVVITDAPVSSLHAANSSPTQLGATTTFTTTIGSGSNVTYAWNFGDGQSGSGASTMHTYAAAGAYTAIVTATNSLGNATAVTPVTIMDVAQAFVLYLPVIQR